MPIDLNTIEQALKERFAQGLGLCAGSDAAESDAELPDAAQIEILTAPVASFGPTERDRAIFHLIYGRGLPEYVACGQFGISSLSCRNIARQTMRRIAREQATWDRMSLLELVAEEERLDDLWQRAMVAWYASQETRYDKRTAEYTRGRTTHVLTTITKTPQTGNVRFLEIARRITGWLRVIGTQIEVRAEEWSAPLSRRVRTVPKRVGRRKRMGGRGLRLPRCVGTTRIARLPAVIWYRVCAVQLVKGAVQYSGIPPPAHP